MMNSVFASRPWIRLSSSRFTFFAHTALLFALIGTMPLMTPERAIGAERHFVPCAYGQPSAACVHDGDTLWWKGEKIRLYSVDAPELGPPRCASPAYLAKSSRDLLIELLNAGTVSLVRHGHDKYGRTLADVLVNGQDVGGMLVSRALARPYVRGQQPWC